MAADPTDDERAAVDALLGPPDSGWVGGERAPVDGHVARGGHAAREQRHRLLPALHALQARVGWISEGGLSYVCRRLDVPPAEAYGVASFYAMFSTEPRPPTVVHVCDDIACRANGAEDLCDGLQRNFGPAGESRDGATWLRSPCLGQCERGPAALVQQFGARARDAAIGEATVADLANVLRPSDGRFSVSTPQVALRQASPPESADSLLLLRRATALRDENPSLDQYRSHGGYESL